MPSKTSTAFISPIAILEICKGSAGVLYALTQSFVQTINPCWTWAICLFGILKIIVGFGILRREEWARRGIQLYLVVIILSAIGSLIIHPWDSIAKTSIFFGIMLAITFIWYFRQKSVKTQFNS